MTTKVQAVQCPFCNDIIFSRWLHDFHYCSCGKTFIDGGFDYLRYGSENLDGVIKLTLEINATEKELYDDWNLMTDKFGVIKQVYKGGAL